MSFSYGNSLRRLHDDEIVIKRTGVAHFLLIDCSNSIVIAKLSRRDLTVRFEPAFVRRVVTSSLRRGK